MVKIICFYLFLLGTSVILTLNVFALENETKTTNSSKTKETKKIKKALIIKLKKELEDKNLKELEKKYKTKLFLLSKELKLYRLDFDQNANLTETMKELKKETFIDYVEEDKPMKIWGKK
ncbi:MAG: hypothetical protein U0457_09640 [Candidatus Sericytochromatia bacterium]